MNYGSNVSRIKRTTKRNGKFVKQNLKCRALEELQALPKSSKIKPRRGAK